MRVERNWLEGMMLSRFLYLPLPLFKIFSIFTKPYLKLIPLEVSRML